MTRAELRVLRRARLECAVCGVPSVPYRCHACREARRAGHRRHYYARKSRNQCISCPATAAINRVRCPVCLALLRAQQKAAVGCPDCKGVPEYGRRRCRPCLDARAAYQAAWNQRKQQAKRIELMNVERNCA